MVVFGRESSFSARTHAHGRRQALPLRHSIRALQQGATGACLPNWQGPIPRSCPTRIYVGVVHQSAVPLTRRRLLAAAIGAGVAGGVWRAPGALAGWEGTEVDWPSAAYDLAGTRAAPIGVRQGRVRWVARLAGGVPGAAAIVGRTVVAASLGGEVAAFDLGTGRERWRVAPPLEPFFAGPAIAAGRVIVASDRACALDLRTGRTLWTAPSLRAGGSDDYFWGPPVVVGAMVLIGSGFERGGGRHARAALRLRPAHRRAALVHADGRTGRQRRWRPGPIDGRRRPGLRHDRRALRRRRHARHEQPDRAASARRRHHLDRALRPTQ